MSEVEKVALWAGLLSSVAGIVLSIVAMVLSIVSNNRATAVNDQTIKSLQKIESAVERLSEDTRTLIKAGWEKLLGSFGADPADIEENTTEPENAPILESPNQRSLPTEESEKVEDLLKRLQQLERENQRLRTLHAKNERPIRSTSTASRTVERLTQILTNLSPRAQALFQFLSEGRHLTETQYSALNRSILGSTLSELSHAGLLVPAFGIDNGQERPVYWLPGSYARAAKVAAQLAPPLASEETALVISELKRVGYTLKT